MNDREILTENQRVVNNTNPDTSNSYSDLDFSTLNTDSCQDSAEVYSAPVCESSVNPFSSEVEASDFATQTQEESVDASPEFLNQNDNDIFLDSEGVFHNETAGELGGTEATGVSRGNFAGDSIANQEEINNLTNAIVNDAELEVDRYGTIRNASANSGLQGTDATGISQGDFAAQWYEKNLKLYQLEKKLMNQRFPNAKELKLSNGNLAWQIKMNISRTDTFDPWTFLLVYMPDHPNNTGYGGSVKVIPLVPNLEQLQSRVKASKGKYFSATPPVPHVVGIDTKYLCTRAPNDIEDGNTTITTAVQVAAWAAEWALYFELSMRDNRVWNKWVDDDHFRKWKII